jgi:hypothetical protein
MDSDVVEVVACFGDTIVDVAHIGPTGAYHIGTAPGVDLEVAGLTRFPLVDGRVVRCPVGMQAFDDGEVTVLRAGALAIRVSRTKLPRASLARPRFDLRVPLFVLASLIAHLAVWLAAVRFAPLERVAIERPRRFTRLIEAPVPPPPPVPSPVIAPKPAVQQVHERRVAVDRKRAELERVRIVSANRGRVVDTVASVAKSFDDIRLEERLGELTAENTYDEDAANAQGFGGGRRFDPSQREGFGTVETGPYATMPYDVKLCPKKSCDVVGPIPALYVRTHLHAHMDAIYDCYTAHADGPGTIVLEFTITADGAVRDARGSGLGETGSCAARVAGEIFFKALGSETRVRYPLRFN